MKFPYFSVQLLWAPLILAGTFRPPPASGTSPSGLSFTTRRQNDSVCAGGGTQYTGTIQVSPTRNLFFWFFESRNDPAKDPTIAWFQGGPGASSMMGLFSEVGPCVATEGGRGTDRLESSWVNGANLLFIDQPAGVGFSTVSSPNSSPTSLKAAGVDVQAFFATFYTSIFPDLAKQPLHLAGESYGGRYAPAFTRYMLDQQQNKAPGGLPASVKIDSIIMIAAAVDNSYTALGIYDHFCSPKEKVGENGYGSGFNATACSAMKRASPQCERDAVSCRTALSLQVCRRTSTSCDAVSQWFDSLVKPGGKNPYDDRTTCTKPPACRDKHFDDLVAYCNRRDVQQALGFDKPIKFEGINFPLNSRWSRAGDPLLPGNRDVETLLNQTAVRVLFINGNHDVAVNTPGQIRTLEAMNWVGGNTFKAAKWEPWSFGGKKRGLRKQDAEGRVVFVSVDQAGHEVPAHQPAAVLNVVNGWIKAS